MKEHIISLYEYSEWATLHLLKVAENLTEEQFVQQILPGFGSVHHTLVHILGAEALWFARWQGLSPKTMLSPEELPSAPAIWERWKKLFEERRADLESMDESRMAETVRWMNMRGQSYALPRWQVMLHCANHSTHHRSEIAAILTELGHEPGSTDLLKFYLERAGQPWKPSVRS